MGGIIRVGCRLTSVCRSEANSEYLLRTWKSLGWVSLSNVARDWGQRYADLYRVDDMAASTLRVLAGKDNQYGIGAFKENLLDATLIGAFLRFDLVGPFVVVLDIAEIVVASSLWSVVPGRSEV